MLTADKLPRTFHTVQYLRGLGALIVVLYHSASQLQRYQPTLHRPEWGAIAVDCFFVISGFIMWHMTAAKPMGLVNTGASASRAPFQSTGPSPLSSWR